MAFYYPFTGLINLFVHILKYPALATAPSDVALMDIVAGHFGRIEYLTSSQLAFPFVREITNLANQVVKKARNRIMEEVAVPGPQMPITNSLMDEPMSSFGVSNFTDVGYIFPVPVFATSANDISSRILICWDLTCKTGGCCKYHRQGHIAPLNK
jgi:hypothetical protein